MRGFSIEKKYEKTVEAIYSLKRYKQKKGGKSQN